jgi:hypothetical protein
MPAPTGWRRNKNKIAVTGAAKACAFCQAREFEMRGTARGPFGHAIAGLVLPYPARTRSASSKRWRMIPKKPVPDLIRDGHRFSDKIMRKWIRI